MHHGCLRCPAPLHLRYALPPPKSLPNHHRWLVHHRRQRHHLTLSFFHWKRRLAPWSPRTPLYEQTCNVSKTFCLVGRSIEFCTPQLKSVPEVSKNTEILLEQETARADLLDEQFRQLQTDAEISLQNERQTISLLVSEKASLLSDLQQLDDAQSSKPILTSPVNCLLTEGRRGPRSRILIDIREGQV